MALLVEDSLILVTIRFLPLLVKILSLYIRLVVGMRRCIPLTIGFRVNLVSTVRVLLIGTWHLHLSWETFLAWFPTARKVLLFPTCICMAECLVPVRHFRMMRADRLMLRPYRLFMIRNPCLTLIVTRLLLYLLGSLCRLSDIVVCFVGGVGN